MKINKIYIKPMYINNPGETNNIELDASEDSTIEEVQIGAAKKLYPELVQAGLSNEKLRNFACATMRTIFCGKPLALNNSLKDFHCSDETTLNLIVNADNNPILEEARSILKETKQMAQRLQFFRDLPRGIINKLQVPNEILGKIIEGHGTTLPKPEVREIQNNPFPGITSLSDFKTLVDTELFPKPDDEKNEDEASMNNNPSLK